MVSAGNSQRNSPAVSECQEELNNAIILSSTTRRSRRKPPSAPHETPNIQPQYAGREWRPFHVRPRWRTDLVLHFPARPQFTVSELKNTRRRGGVNKRHMINTTSLRSPTSQNTSHHAQHRTHLQTHPSPPSTTRRHVENHPPNLTKHPILQPQYAGRESCPFHVRPWMEDGLRHSIFLPDHSLRYRRLKSTRRRGGVEGKEMVHHTEQSHQQKNTHFRKLPYRITLLLPTPPIAQNRSSRHVTYCHLTQLADIAARHPREGRRGDASGC